MHWKKLGKICDSNSFELDWCRKNIMAPVPYEMEDRIRIFVAMCDSENRGRIGFIDVEKDNPCHVLDYSRKPSLDLGEVGMFDEDGVLPSSYLERDGKIWMFYSAYQKQAHVPYVVLSGLAVSKDNGVSFKRVHSTPILERRENEIFLRSAIEVMYEKGKYVIWYASGNEWFNRKDKIAPRYDLKRMESDYIDTWLGDPLISLSLRKDEYGFTTPQVWKDNNKYHMIYSVRSISKGYRIGYAESEDGICFRRMDEEIDIDVSKDGFDSEMICYGRMIMLKDKTYLFYCGNHYGMEGLGCAKLEEENLCGI